MTPVQRPQPLLVVAVCWMDVVVLAEPGSERA